MATAGVMLLKGPQARRYTQKAVHSTGGLWPPRESCYLRGHRQGGTHKRRCTQQAVCGHRKSHVIEGPTGKAVHTEGGAHNRRSVATAGAMLLKGPQARRYTQKSVHTQGGTHKRRSVATAGVMLLKGPQARRYTQKAVHTKGGLWPPQESCY